MKTGEVPLFDERCAAFLKKYLDKPYFVWYNCKVLTSRVSSLACRISGGQIFKKFQKRCFYVIFEAENYSGSIFFGGVIYR